MTTDEAMQHYLKGHQLFGRNEFGAAIEEYRRALELAPEWTDALAGLAMAHMNHGTLDEAVAAAERWIAADPEDPMAHTSLSMIYQRKNLIPEAEKEQAKARMLSWKKELQTNPNAPPPGPAGGMDVIQ